MSFIEFKNVSFNYDESEKIILNNISASFEKGDFVAVLGHNGSGKSTFAKLINGLLIAKSGCVTVDGIDASDENTRIDLLQRVGMVFQNPDNQIVASIVEEDVAFGPENLGVQPEEIRKRVDKALKTVGMYEYRKKSPHNLSGGQKQRVAIAGILAMNPQCIIMDEATAMLDPKGREEVMSSVKELNEQLGITIIYITHFMEEATLAKRVIVLDDGEIKLDGTPKSVFSHYDTIKEVGLDVPQPYELMRKLGVNECVLNADECASILEGLIENNVDSGN